MFPGGSIGVISGNQEQTFGLQALRNRRCILIYDLPENFHERMDMGSFKSIVAGERVGVPMKNKEAVQMDWQTPLAVAGNALMKYQDPKGSISKRTVVFEFLSKVQELNTELLNEIQQHELASIFLRCVQK